MDRPSRRKGGHRRAAFEVCSDERGRSITSVARLVPSAAEGATHDGMASRTVWPGFVKVKKIDHRMSVAMANDKWLTGGPLPDFERTNATTEKEAQVAADMWLRHPAYKMTLAAVQQGVDANNDVRAQLSSSPILPGSCSHPRMCNTSNMRAGPHRSGRVQGAARRGRIQGRPIGSLVRPD